MEPDYDRVHIPDDVVAREFPDETVVLHLGTGQYHGLNAVGALMLAALRELGDIPAAAGRVAQETGASIDEVTADMRAFCEQLADRGLVEPERGG